MDSIGTDLPSKSQRKNLFEFKSIKTELVVIIIIMLIVSGTVLTVIAAFMASNALEQGEIEKLTSVGEGTSHKLELITEMGKDFTSILSIDPDTIAMLIQYLEDGTVIREEQIELSEYLTQFQEELTIPLSMVAIYNLDGIIMSSSDQSTLGRDDSSQKFFVHQQKRAYIGEPFLDAGAVPVIPYAQPMYDEGGRQIGLAVIGHQYSGFDKDVFSTPGLSDDATNFLVSPDGTILSGIRGDYSSFLTKKFDVGIFSAGTKMVHAPGYFGHMEYIVKTPVPGTNWFIITTESVQEINGQIMSLVMAMVVSLLIVIIAGALGTFFITNIFARPILALTEIAEQLALGAVNVSITHTGSNEVGQLADALRHIVDNTKQRLNLAKKIALGDIVFEIPVLSDEDEERHALIQMKSNLVAMTESLQTLAHQAAEGNLSYRADASQFQGAYCELIETLNQTFDVIITPVQETIRLSISYSSGDYSDRFNPGITVKGDFVPVKAALNQIGINSSDILFKIRSEAHDISADTAELSTDVEEIANSASTLAESSSHVSLLSDQNDASLDQVLIAMNDLRSAVGEVAHRTTAASELVSHSSNLAYDGVKHAELAGTGMERIIKSFERISKAVSDMSNQMEEISGIVDVISGIAEHTSLLALNAAIEAARAGDSGVGFAVVADEVKSLAQKSQTSAEHINSIIGNLQKMSTEMTNAMKKATDVMQDGSNAVNETIVIFNQMAEAISDVNKNMGEVAAASEEQAASVQEIAAGMSEVRDMVQNTAIDAASSATATEEISASLGRFTDSVAHSAQLAKAIEERVGQFKIE